MEGGEARREEGRRVGREKEKSQEVGEGSGRVFDFVF